MQGVTGDLVAGGELALAAGRWADARAAFEAALAGGESPQACFGLSTALWWLGDSDGSVAWCTKAYAAFRREGDVEQAVRCAIWLALTYKANFSNFAAANGWLHRADRLLAAVEPGPLHAWTWVVSAYRMAGLDEARTLTERAAEVARAAGDVDLELVALSQLGLIRVGQGHPVEGFALVDEAIAAALAGEPSVLDTVVYTCCDMLRACELANDLERAAQWCEVADGFVERYGCPFLYAECRIMYGGVLSARGRWAEAEQALIAGARTSEVSSPALHARAVTRLATLRVRQGRLEEAAELLDVAARTVEPSAEGELAAAELLLARGNPAGARQHLDQHWDQFASDAAQGPAADDLLVDACLGVHDLAGADAASQSLAATVAPLSSERLHALLAGALGRVEVARGNATEGVEHLKVAMSGWWNLRLPYEQACTELEIGLALVDRQRDVAVAHGSRALAGFTELGASLQADRATAFLRGAGFTPRPGPKAGGVLTQRELQVLGLLGIGLTNPEIAARLHISRKTASHHVSRILAKLHLRNRAEAAAYASRLHP